MINDEFCFKYCRMLGSVVCANENKLIQVNNTQNIVFSFIEVGDQLTQELK